MNEGRGSNYPLTHEVRRTECRMTEGRQGFFAFYECESIDSSDFEILEEGHPAAALHFFSHLPFGRLLSQMDILNHIHET